MFFNSKDAETDLDHWVRAAFWTIDEAVSLISGRDPRKVSWKLISPYTGWSPFAKKYEALKQLADRAVAMNQLSTRNIPGFFTAWTVRNRIDVPEDLVEALDAHGVQIADWKTLYDKQSEIIDTQNDTIESLKVTNGQLREFAAATKKPEEWATRIKELGTRERDSLLNLVIGMAVGGYAYDPTKSRNDATKDIAGDLERLGVPLDRDTILKWLRAGAEFLPQEQETE